LHGLNFHGVNAPIRRRKQQRCKRAAEVLAHTLAPNGTAWLADPGRVARDAFIRALAPRALRVTDRTKRIFSEGTIQQTVTIFEVRHFD